MRVGLGFDVHRLVVGRDCILGGVTIPHEKGLLGHSDADVLVHAIMDAFLGAAALGDIGLHFPDNDQAYKNADSIKLLQKISSIVAREGYHLVNLDAVIMAEKPKIAPYISRMRENLALAIGCDQNQVSVKATTTEKIGFVGREEGIAAQAVVLLDNRKASDSS